MNDSDQQSIDLEDDEHIQITDLDAVGTNQKRFTDKLFAILHKGIATPWIRYSSVSLLLLILLGALFLQIYPSALTSSSSSASNETGVPPSASGANVTFGDDQIYIQANGGMLTAYQAENGHVLWHKKLPAQASLLASGQIVYLYYATTAGNGRLEALNGNNGRSLWWHALPAPGTALALEQSGDALYAADDSNTIYAFQASNGHLRWTYRDNIRPILPVGNLLQVKSGIAEIFQADQGQSFLHTSDGRQILHIQPDNSGNLPQAIIDGRLIYVLPNIGDAPVPQPVQVFRVSDGKLLWSWALPYTSSEVSLMEQDGIIFYRDDINSSLIALSSTDGHVLWTYKAPSNANGIVSTDLEETGLVYLALQYGNVICLRAGDGQILWNTQIKVANQYNNPPGFFFENGKIFLYYANGTAGGTTSENDQEYTLSSSDGKVLWHTSGFSGQPWIQASILYTMQPGGRIDAWRASDGSHLWDSQALAGMYPYGDPTNNNNLVFLTDQLGNVEVLRANDGKLLWRYRVQ